MLTSARVAMVAAAFFGVVGATSVQQQDVVIFRNARLIDGDGRVLSPRGTLRVENGRVATVGLGGGGRAAAGEREIDLEGRSLLPGLVNAHGHVADTLGLQSGAAFYTEANLRAQLRRYADYGITTVVSLGGDGPAGFRLRDAEGTGALDRARVLLAGPVITARAPADAVAEVDRVAAMKPDFIKIRVDDNLGATTKMPIEVARAVLERAHHHKLKVAAHIFYLDDAKALLRAGVDFIAHSIRDQPVDDEVIGLLKSRDVCVCPTLTREVSTFVYESEPAFFSDPFFLKHADQSVLAALRDPKRQAQIQASKSAQRYKAALDVATANMKRLADAGVTLAMGTDTGPPARFQGYFEHLELEMMVKGGLSPAAAIASATGNVVRCLGLPDVGSIRPGRRADLLVVRGNPLDDVRNLRQIESVWIGGAQLR